MEDEQADSQVGVSVGTCPKRGASAPQAPKYVGGDSTTSSSCPSCDDDRRSAVVLQALEGAAPAPAVDWSKCLVCGMAIEDGIVLAIGGLGFVHLGECESVDRRGQ